ncbi:hypothetical protein GE061_011798 [Apolygus lucorum]|uniref:NADH dehydrogenase [ubiquinone] 1 beta subcomplex subunit 5, mitochondrial n=1 Tax=Apolygus lucorum TaxID=248454 RepID=A0A6A4K1U9_APOLU|nr:hypothetical protein GE061_011798 [Apolygus lucorum]
MPGWSSLGGSLLRTLVKPSNSQFSKTIVRSMSGHRTMPIQPSRWQYQKFKDLLHFYFLVGAIPVTCLIFYTNVFIGPAKLAEIPEGYEPKHWEYYKHPITRFLARYVFTSHQQEYEKYMHLVYEEDEKMKIRALEKKVRDLMEERADYQAYYYKPISGKYVRQAKRQREAIEETSGISID